jgi:hypothetical protein
MAERGHTRGRRSAAPWIFLVALLLAGVVGLKSGWMGYGWAHVRSSLFPRDESLLEWVPADAMAVVIFDPHQMPFKSLPTSNVVRADFDRTRNDVKKLTGVDLAFDVDKAVVTPNLVIMRGRFDAASIADKLAEYRYVKADYAGRSYVVRSGEDAVMVAGDELLFYGDETAIRAAIDAKAGVAVVKNERVTARLARMGWNEPLVGTVQLGDDRPSVRAVLMGARGPRAVTFGIKPVPGVGGGFDVRVSVEASSARAAEDLASDLEARRAAGADALKPYTGTDLAVLVAQAASAATVKADTTAGVVDMSTRVSGDSLDAMVRAAEKSEFLQATYKTIRLYQLFVPAP